MRPYLVQRYCKDPNPHRPHPWPQSDPDEDVRYFCVGVSDVLSAEIHALLGGTP